MDRPARHDTPPDAARDMSMLDALGSRDSHSLKLLYEQHAAAVFSVCLRILRDHQDAEDLLVDVFFEFWENPDRFSPDRGSVLTYLIVLARSRAIDRLRRRARSVAASTSDAAPAVAVLPADNLIEHEDQTAIRAALAQLDPKERQAIECAFFDDLSHSEIAAKLDKPLGTIKSNIRQGLIHLREILRTYYRSR